MANIIDLLTLGNLKVASVDADPSTGGGLTADVCSLAVFNNSGVGEFFQKTGVSDTAWTAVGGGSPDVSTATGTLAIGHGGTGLTGTPTDGELAIGNGSGYTLATLAAASNSGIQITNGSGTITLGYQYAPYSATVNTTDATPTILATLPTTSDSTLLANITVVGRHTGGVSGVTDDSACFQRTLSVKNVSGTVTVNSIQSDYTFADQEAWDVAFDVSSTNVNVMVTGAIANNITWDLLAFGLPV